MVSCSESMHSPGVGDGRVPLDDSKPPRFHSEMIRTWAMAQSLTEKLSLRGENDKLGELLASSAATSNSQEDIDLPGVELQVESKVFEESEEPSSTASPGKGFSNTNASLLESSASTCIMSPQEDIDLPGFELESNGFEEHHWHTESYILSQRNSDSSTTTARRKSPLARTSIYAGASTRDRLQDGASRRRGLDIVRELSAMETEPEIKASDWRNQKNFRLAFKGRFSDSNLCNSIVTRLD